MASRTREKGEAAISELKERNLPGTISLQLLDVTSSKSVSAAAEAIEKEFGKLDFLINNAGVVSQDPDLEVRMRATLDANATGAAVASYGFEPLLKKSNNPRIVHVSSALGSLTLRDNLEGPDSKTHSPAYRMSKAALSMLAIITAKEFGKWGCKVWAMCPGWVVTNLTGPAGREFRIKGGALSAETSAETIFKIGEGERDAEVGKFVHKDGVYPW